MTKKIPDSIHALVPSELRSDYGIYWQEKTQRYYVYRDLGYVYDAAKGRSVARRFPLGSIKDGKFQYSPSYLKNQQIAELAKQVSVLQGNSVPSVEQTVQKSGRKGLVKSIRKASRAVEDTRQEAKVCFPLDVVLFVALLAACGGYTSAVSIAIYWRQNRAELEALLENFPEQDISHDTVNRLLRLIDPKYFQQMVRDVCSPLIRKTVPSLVHIDGQAVKASKNAEHKAGYYVFNSYDSTNDLALAAKMIGRKKNEISEAVDLLKMLDLDSSDIVTADAMNTQRELVSYLHGRNVGYCLAVKENQPALASEIRAIFGTTHPDQIRILSDLDADHGRIENRTVRVISGKLLSKVFKERWPGVHAGSLVEATTQTEKKSDASLGDLRVSRHVRYFITTLKFNDSETKRAMQIVRQHWSIENKLHWVLDNHFSQDRIQCKNVNYLSNRVALNKIGLNLIRAARNAEIQRGNKAFSIKTYMQLCNTAAGTLDVLALISDIDTALASDVKD